MKNIILNTTIVCLISFTFSACSENSTTYKGVGANSLSQKDLNKYAPKMLDAETLSNIESHLDINGPSGGYLTEDGNHLFVNWSVTGTRQVWRVDKDKRFPTQLTGGQDRTSVNGIIPKHKLLIISRDVAGEENPGLYLQSYAGGRLKKVFNKKGVRAFFEKLSDDENSIYYSANDQDPASYTIYKYSIKTGDRIEILNRKGTWGISDIKNGKVLVRKALGNFNIEYFEVNENTGAVSPVLGQGEGEDYSAFYGANKDELIVRTNKFGEFYRLYSYKNGKFTPISPAINYELMGAGIDNNRKRLIFSINKDGYHRLHAIDAKTFKEIKLPAFESAEQVSQGRTTLNSRYTVFYTSSYNRARQNFIYDWKTQELDEWTYHSSPEIDTKDFVRPTLENYKAKDGTPIPMFVYRPNQCKDKSCPVIVNFHGGPEAQSLPYFNPMAQLIVKEGFIFVKPNVRGSYGYGKKWLHADNGPNRLNVITDIADCAKFIKSEWKKDGNTPKVGIMGGSYGGYSTLVGMTIFSGHYDVGVATVGMGNLVSFLKNTSPYRRHLRTSEYGDPEKDLEALKKLSPINYIDKISAPLMILHGANDPRVPVGESLQIQKTLEDKKLKSELVIFPDEGHGFRKRKNKALGFGYTLEFFKKHLKPI